MTSIEPQASSSAERSAPASSDKTRPIVALLAERAGMSTLREGQKVDFEVVAGQNGKSSAENLVAND